MRDPSSDIAASGIRRITPAQMVEYGVRMGAKVVGSSYNEPLITSEWAVSVFKAAQAEELTCAYVSNGNATPEVLEYLRPHMSAYKVDLKTMQDRQYRRLGGVLQNVLDSIKLAHEMGFWTEVVTLVIPGFNDSNEELMEAGRFLAGISPDIPWHVTAFHKDYKMTDPDNTTTESLIRAAEIGYEAGLRYVYAGNLPGRVEGYEDTHCPNCSTTLIERLGYVILAYRLTENGRCPTCDTRIPGIWPSEPGEVRQGSARDLLERRPRAVR
jgi:pyruvate formate lyase activating enzyme